MGESARGRRWTQVGLVLGLAGILLGIPACRDERDASKSGGRPLSVEELAEVRILDGGVSPWLPSHFSVTLQNGTELTIVGVELEIDGRPFARSARIGPGEEATIRLQYLFPEDDGYGEAERAAVEWRLSGASALEEP